MIFTNVILSQGFSYYIFYLPYTISIFGFSYFILCLLSFLIITVFDQKKKKKTFHYFIWRPKTDRTIVNSEGTGVGLFGLVWLLIVEKNMGSLLTPVSCLTIGVYPLCSSTCLSVEWSGFLFFFLFSLCVVIFIFYYFMNSFLDCFIDVLNIFLLILRLLSLVF